MLTSSIVTNPRVPRLVRHSLNLESGLNDGLALPAVLTFAAALSADSGHFVWWRFVLQDVGLGFLYGIACGWIASVLMPRESGRPRGEGDSRRTSARCSRSASRSRPTASTVLSPKGNGFIAVFVAAIVLSVRRPDVREHFERNSEEIVEIVKLGIFFVFGSLLTVDAFTREGWAAIAFVAVIFLHRAPAGRVAVAAGHPHGRRHATVHGLVRPQGRRVDDLRADRARPISIADGVRIFDLTALVVFCSIIVHGITDTPGANWIARRSRGAVNKGDEAAAAGASEPDERTTRTQACSAACSWAEGNAHAARERRSWRNTKRSCCGGRSCASLGRKVAHGSGRSSAQSRLQRK